MVLIATSSYFLEQISHLWSSIIRTTAVRFKKMTITCDIAKSKVGNLYVAFGIQKKVLRLQISMNHLVEVAKFNAWNNLQLNKISSHFFLLETGFTQAQVSIIWYGNHWGYTLLRKVIYPRYSNFKRLLHLHWPKNGRKYR